MKQQQLAQPCCHVWALPWPAGSMQDPGIDPLAFTALSSQQPTKVLAAAAEAADGVSSCTSAEGCAVVVLRCRPGAVGVRGGQPSGFHQDPDSGVVSGLNQDHPRRHRHTHLWSHTGAGAAVYCHVLPCSCTPLQLYRLATVLPGICTAWKLHCI